MKTIEILGYVLHYQIVTTYNGFAEHNTTEFYYGTEITYRRKYFGLFGPNIGTEKLKFAFRIPLVNIDDVNLIGTDALKNCVETFVTVHILNKK